MRVVTIVAITIAGSSSGRTINGIIGPVLSVTFAFHNDILALVNIPWDVGQ